MTEDPFMQIRMKQLKTIEKISEEQSVLTQVELEDKYKEFADTNPKTWQAIMDRSFPIQHLRRKIELYSKFYERTKGEHQEKKFKADVKFGEHLAEEYLYPHTGKPSQQAMNEALAKAKKKLEQ